MKPVCFDWLIREIYCIQLFFLKSEIALCWLCPEVKSTSKHKALQLQPYSESGRSVSYEFEDYLKIDFHDWIIIQTLLYCLPPLYSNVVCLRQSIVDYRTIEVLSQGNGNMISQGFCH